MNMIHHKDTSIDDLTRDPKDGAYHCPKCEAPFTRRSNLRRHYTIHTRHMEFKCHLCSKGFARSDELHYHALQCPGNWDTPTDRTFQPMSSLQPTDILDRRGNFMGVPSPPETPSSHLRENMPLADSFTPVDSPPAQDDQDFSDFLSSLASSPMLDTSQLPDMSMYDLRSPQGFPPSNMPRLTPPSSSSNNSVMSSPADTHARLRPQQSSFSRYNGVSKRRTTEKPVYTRRQVNDMLDAVSSCFVGTIEEVLRRANAQGQS